MWYLSHFFFKTNINLYTKAKLQLLFLKALFKSLKVLGSENVVIPLKDFSIT